MKTKEQILEWVRTQYWYDDFIKNLNTTCDPKLGLTVFWEGFEKEPERLISSAFVWEETPQGGNFWRDIDIEYRAFLRSRKKTIK